MNHNRFALEFILVAVFISILLFLSPSTIGAQENEPQVPANPNSAVGTAFTYQGRLTDGGAPANGNYEFRFYLWAEEGKTTLLGTYPGTGTVSVNVEDGYFTTTLDFGVGIFDGDECWLEIEVNGSLLAPLQSITPTPYAIYAQHAPWDGLTNVPTGFADGTDDGITEVYWPDILNRPLGLDDGDQDTTYSPGYGLGLDTTTFNVLTDTIQARVTGTCGTGFAIRQVNSDGSVVCEEDDFTTYTNGDGLELTGNVFSVDFAGSGSASTVAHSDHDHDGVYVNEGQPDSITTGMVQEGTLLFADINQNGCGPDQVMKWFGGSWACADDETGLADFWSLTGNSGTNPGTDYLGTSDNQSLELRVNNQRALYLEPSEISPNVIGGFGGNYVLDGVHGAAIAGGGTPDEEGVLSPNRVRDHYGSVVGGANNQAGNDDLDFINAIYAFVGGGYSNRAHGGFSSIVGGDANQAFGNHVSIGGGMVNIAWGLGSNISGGEWNQAGGINAVVGGGSHNHAIGDYSTIAGGVGITVTAYAGTVAGGENNIAEGESSSIGGGLGNYTIGVLSAIGGGYANVAPGYYSNINGGMTNDAIGDFSVVGGGYDNAAMNAYSTVGGGSMNVAWADYATICGGGPLDPNDPLSINQITDNYGTIGGGADHNVGSHDGDPTNSPFATISGGVSNTASGGYSFIGGGQENNASGEWSTICGGDYNINSGQYATIGGGWSNISEAYGAVVGGGIGNRSSGNKSGVGAGTLNITIQEGAYIGGGESNYVLGLYGFIGGGLNNETLADYATVGGGGFNTASGLGSVVAGGGGIYETETYTNTASGDWSSISGGIKNTAGGNSSSIGGGEDNTANSWASTVAGGSNNVANNLDSTIGGGANNISSGGSSTVGGGWANRAEGTGSTVSGGDNNIASATSTTVGGGQLNSAEALASTVGGGYQNNATDDYATVGGGQSNEATSPRSTVAGGINNSATNWNATVAGGYNNTASGGGTFVGGGDSNTASGAAATVPGGFDNDAGGDYSFAAGYKARIHSDGDGSFVWSDSSSEESIWSYGPNQFLARATGGFWLVTGINEAGGFTSGLHLAPGSSTWTTTSDRNAKTNFAPVDGREILDLLSNIPVETWNYKTQDASIRHLGPMAQDFYAAYGLGLDERHIDTVDLDGVALASIQGLYAISQEQAEQIEDLQVENASLRKQLSGGFPEGESHSISIFVYALAGVVVLLLGGFIWILVRFHSLLPAEASHAR
jgi:hypothetical protein